MDVPVNIVTRLWEMIDETCRKFHRDELVDRLTCVDDDLSSMMEESEMIIDKELVQSLWDVEHDAFRAYLNDHPERIVALGPIDALLVFTVLVVQERFREADRFVSLYSDHSHAQIFWRIVSGLDAFDYIPLLVAHRIPVTNETVLFCVYNAGGKMMAFVLDEFRRIHGDTCPFDASTWSAVFGRQDVDMFQAVFEVYVPPRRIVELVLHRPCPESMCVVELTNWDPKFINWLVSKIADMVKYCPEWESVDASAWWASNVLHSLYNTNGRFSHLMLEGNDRFQMDAFRHHVHAWSRLLDDATSLDELVTENPDELVTLTLIG